MNRYVDDPHLQVGMTQYNKDMIEGRDVYTENKQFVGTVTLDFDNENGNGEQVYAVVKNPNLPEDQVTEVTVLFRGSTGPNEVLSKPVDVWNDWVENDLFLGLRVFAQDHPNYTQNHDHASGQLKASSETLNTIMATYPNAKVNLYGHSLGSMDVQYAIANLSDTDINRLESAYIYNGPNIYGILDDQQKARVDSVKGLIHNYADPKDPVSMVGRDLDKGSLDSVGMVHFVESKDIDLGNQHMTYGYQLDSSDNIKVLQTSSTEGVNAIIIEMSRFQQMKQTLSRGGFSSRETIYLDSEQARILAQGLVKIAETTHQTLEKETTSTLTEVNEVYSSLGNVPFGFILSPDEVRQAYSSAGVDYHSLVGDSTNQVEKFITRFNQLKQDLVDLESQIQAGIEQKVTEDQTLAQRIQEWTSTIN
ncbi:TPA: triacylglycerol lipase [Streptococcus suis]